jgi:uncharacterized repeat protein (TIGR03803 family)
MMKRLIVLAGLWICICVGTASFAQKFGDLGKFNYEPDGAYPYGSLVQGLDGNFYGEAVGGGVNSQQCGSIVGCGTVSKAVASGGLSALYSFCAQANCPDGESPMGGLTLATNGNLYGVTYRGGANGHGSVFQITPAGEFTTIYSFCSGCDDGVFPIGGLTQGSDGNLYGTSSMSGKYNGGTIFKITLSGTLTTLYAFCPQTNCPDGAVPEATLVQAGNGNFYGTTISGGANDVGTIFEISPAGKFSTLYSFCSQPNCEDGKYPFAGLMQATNGNLYGTAEEGGSNGYGTIFRITTSGKFTALYNFCSQPRCRDGELPSSALVQASDGKLYGSSGYGGDTDFCDGYGCGLIYEFTPPGKLKVLYTFCSTGDCSSGAFPQTFIQGTDGAFYSVAPGGGTNNFGTVFGFSIGLPAFVNTLPTAGGVGSQVVILGNGLTGTSIVTFNGAAAAFTVVSDTELLAAIPSGATTGKVHVVTPKGTLSTIKAFRVFR